MVTSLVFVALASQQGINGSENLNQAGILARVVEGSLDGQNNVLMIGLTADVWVAYDEATGGLLKLWEGKLGGAGATRTSLAPSGEPATPLQSVGSAKVVHQVVHGEALEDAKVSYAGVEVGSNNSVTVRFKLESGLESVVLSETPTLCSMGTKNFFVTRFCKLDKPGVVVKSLLFEVAKSRGVDFMTHFGSSPAPLKYGDSEPQVLEAGQPAPKPRAEMTYARMTWKGELGLIARYVRAKN